MVPHHHFLVSFLKGRGLRTNYILHGGVMSPPVMNTSRAALQKHFPLSLSPSHVWRGGALYQSGRLHHRQTDGPASDLLIRAVYLFALSADPSSRVILRRI